MLTFDDSYFLGETRDGFYIEPMMKCAWAAQLEVMCVIKQICEKNDIPYFAYYGTLLGTIRHKGFIPWDDDMDICMLRKDYQRFLEVAPRELTGEYHINSPYTQDEYTYVFSRILMPAVFLMIRRGYRNFTGVPILSELIFSLWMLCRRIPVRNPC